MKLSDTFEVTAPGEREIVMARDFDAPAEMIFDALTKPELVQRWLLGPDGWIMPVCEIDLKVGGAWRYVWRNEENGREFGMQGEYREIVRPERIVHTEIFEKTLRTNTLGPWLVAQAFVPLLEKSAAPRIVNVSSGGGQLDGGADGWAPAYCVSKTALNGVTAQLAAALPRFAVNSVCPGWVRTDMGGEGATRSVGEGASGIVWLATEAPHELTGKFVKDRKVIPW